ncbi:MAG: hypothetical protein V9F01_06760 [Chitinophagaceae bacterium]
MRHFQFLLVISFLLNAVCSGQNVGIGTATPNASAQLDVSSTTKGILIPRMTDAEKNAIPSPAPGLLIYNTNTNSFQYYHGTSWVNISHSGIINGTVNKVAKFNSPWGLTAAGLITDNGTGVAINNTNTLPNSSALLDLTSNNKGILIPRMTTAERTVIAAPATGLLVFDNTTNSFWFHNGSQWMELNTGGGSTNWAVLGNNIYNNNSGNVGIGASTPFAKLTVNGDAVIAAGLGIATTTPDLVTYKLDVNGNIHNTGDIYTSGSVGIGTTIPIHKLQVDDGSVGIYNSSDSKYWVMYYNGINNSFQIAEDATPRVTILNGGNVGLGTTSPAYKLDVAGAIRASGNIQSQGNVSIAGTATVNSGDGIVRSSNGNQLRTQLFTAPLSVGLGAGTSYLFNITFPAFTSVPHISVAQVAEGTYSYRKLVYNIHDVTTTAAQITIFNPTDEAAVIDGIFKAIIIGVDN